MDTIGNVRQHIISHSASAEYFTVFFDSEVFRNFVDAFRAFSVYRQIRTDETVEMFTKFWYNEKKKGGEAMFGAVYGDVIGSYYEAHCTKNYDFEFNKDSSFTDDSVLIAAVSKAILNNPSDISKWNLRARAKEYASQYRQYYSYHPHAGFGNMFAAWAKDPYARNGHSR